MKKMLIARGRRAILVFFFLCDGTQIRPGHFHDFTAIFPFT